MSWQHSRTQRIRNQAFHQNSSHDFSGKNAHHRFLAVWPHNRTTLSYNSVFVPDGCNMKASYNCTTTGAGVDFDKVYQFANMQNATFSGGYAGTVGMSG
jgi:hypothetical protein